MSNVTWVYIQSEPNCYTVGFYALNGDQYTDSDHSNIDAAADRVQYLNGHNVLSVLREESNKATQLSKDAKKVRDDRRGQYWWGYAQGIGAAIKAIKQGDY